jgi:GntR family transcriptional regulator/MocR family aminotransferase
LPLRRAIAAYLTAARAVHCNAEHILIVSGAQQALDLASRVLVDPEDSVWIEDPGYPGVHAAFRAAGAQLIPVPVDEEGLNVQAGIARAANARLVYVTPSHQFPLGWTMTLARRLELLNWSQRARAWIIEDDYDSEYRYTSRPIPALQGLAAQKQVIYVGTFSKVLFPSLRLGYLVLPSALVDVFTAARTGAAGYPPLIEQAVLTEFITEGHFGRHIRRMRTFYEERRAVLLDEARHELAGLLEVQVSDAGLHAIGWLPQGADDRLVAKLAAAEGVDAAPLSDFYRGEGKRSGLMLGFAAFNATDLRSGARKLARALRTMKRGRGLPPQNSAAIL